MPDAVARLLGSLPVLKPVIPDPGIRFQLVHEDDVASAFAAGVRGLGRARPYNLAGKRHAHDVGRGRRARLVLGAGAAAAVVEATAEIATRLPLMPEQVAWIHSVRKPVLMKTDAGEASSSLAAQAHGEGHPQGDGRRSEGGAVQLRVVLLRHLARVQERRAVAHRALHERRDAVLRDADLRQAGGQPEPSDRPVT